MRNAFTSLLALGLVAAAPACAQAAGVTVSYNLDVGPLTVTEVKFTVTVSGGEAHGKARIRTAGMSRVFSEFGATAVGEARLVEASPEPVTYTITRDESDTRKVTTVRWDGGPPSYDPPMKKSDRKERLDAAIANGVVDPFTAVLRIGMAGDSYDVAFAPVAELDDGRKLWLPVEMSGKLKSLNFRGYVTKVSD